MEPHIAPQLWQVYQLLAGEVDAVVPALQVGDMGLVCLSRPQLVVVLVPVLVPLALLPLNPSAG